MCDSFSRTALMTVLAWILLFSVIGGALSVIAAAAFLLLSAQLRHRALPHLVSFAIGALLGAAFLALLPHALNSPYVEDTHDVTATVLMGLLGFFLLEKLVLWRHCHSGECEVHAPEHDHDHRYVPARVPGRPNAAGTLILVGDAFHNLVDGVLIAAAFLTDVQLGIVTALAVAAHEIPQELGDFAILLESGYGRYKAFMFNLLSSSTTVAGGLAAYFALSAVESLVPYVLAVAASSFIYVAVADLIPSLHRRVEVRATVQQLVLIMAGVGLIFLAHTTMH